MTERFISPFPLPSDHERELLTILIEECSEVQQRATKMLRFGRDEVQPGQTASNRERLSYEIGDLWVMINLVEAAELIDGQCIMEGRTRKRQQLAKFMQTRALGERARDKEGK